MANDLRLTADGGTPLNLRFIGDPILQGIVEFISAVRLGSPSQDDRNLASFVVFEDGREGMGQWEGDIREDLAKHYDANGVNVRKFGQAILPLQYEFHEMTGNSKETLANLHTNHTHVMETDIDGTTRFLVAYGDQIWYSDGSTFAITQTTNAPGFTTTDTISQMIEYILPADGASDSAGDRYLVVSSFQNSAIKMSKTPLTGSWTSINPGPGSTDDMFIFDGKLWLMGQNSLSWTIDPANADSYVEVQGSYPYRWKFVGIAPFGVTFMPYVLLEHHSPTRAQLAVLDVDRLRVVPLELGISGIVQARPMGENIGIIADYGREVYIYSPANNGLRAMDFQARERHGLDDDTRAVDLIYWRGQVVALTNNGPQDSTTTGDPRRMIHNGAGWHYMDAAGTNFTGNTKTHIVPGGKYIPHLNGFVSCARPNTTSSGVMMAHYHSDEPYRAGQDYPVEFDGVGGRSYYTPWFDMGFADLEGALLAIRCGGFFDANNLINVYYQVDNPADLSVWTQIGTFPNTGVPASPEISNRNEAVERENVLLVGGDLFGQSFTKARFRFQLEQDDTDSAGTADEPNQSPNAFPMVIQFLKRPELRDSLRFTIDVEETLGANEHISGVFDLAKALRVLYDTPGTIKAEWGEQLSYMFITSFPRVYQLSPEGAHQDLPNLEGGTFVLSLAEPL